MKKVFCSLLVILLLIACSPSQEEIQATVQASIAETQKAMPTETPVPTATPIPFSEFDLEDLLVQDNDLPAGYSGAQASNTAPQMFSSVPKPEYSIYQQFEKSGKQTGGVAVFLYDDLGKVDSAYKLLLDGMGKTEIVNGNWDKGNVVDYSIGMTITLDGVDLLFSHCHSVVHIRITGTRNKSNVITYAERLDKRLSSLVCREP